MRIRDSDSFFVYIITNPRKTVLYTGMTNDLKRRLKEHFDSRGKADHFASKFFCFKLLYFEVFDTAREAIFREKEIKNMTREKKLVLIKEANSEMDFLVI